MKTKGFTLLELMVVIAIIGVLATVGLINYSGFKEKIADREAISNLKMLQSAEIGYKLETGSYYPILGSPSAPSVIDIPAINANLSVALSNNANPNWNHKVFENGCVQARRRVGDLRYFNLTINYDGDPDATINQCP